MNGLEATRKIKALEKHIKIPIIALTAESLSGKKEEIPDNRNDRLSHQAIATKKIIRNGTEMARPKYRAISLTTLIITCKPLLKDINERNRKRSTLKRRSA